MLDVIFDRAGPKNKAKKKVKPYAKHCNKTEEEKDKCMEGNESGSYPVLHLFFEGSHFKQGVITADTKMLKVNSDIFNAILAFIGSYYVFYVGYKEDIKYFFGFLQQTLLDDKFESKVHIGFTTQMHKVRLLDNVHNVPRETVNAPADVNVPTLPYLVPPNTNKCGAEIDCYSESGPHAGAGADKDSHNDSNAQSGRGMGELAAMSTCSGLPEKDVQSHVATHMSVQATRSSARAGSEAAKLKIASWIGVKNNKSSHCAVPKPKANKVDRENEAETDDTDHDKKGNSEYAPVHYK